MSVRLSASSYLPDADLKDAIEELRVGSDEGTDINDKLLLEDGLYDVVREALGIKYVLDVIW